MPALLASPMVAEMPGMGASEDETTRPRGVDDVVARRQADEAATRSGTAAAGEGPAHVAAQAHDEDESGYTTEIEQGAAQPGPRSEEDR